MQKGETRELNEDDLKTFASLDRGEKTIAFVGDRWLPQTVKQKEDKVCKRICVMYERNMVNAGMSEASL